jgi:hypothetical protein
MNAPWVLGLDLGRVRDPSSLAVLEPWREGWILIHLKTFRPQREDMLDALDVPRDFLRRNAPPSPVALAIDARGVGLRVAQTAVSSVTWSLVYPLLPSFSNREYRQRTEDLFTWVGKDYLISLLGKLFLGTRQLQIAPGLAEADELIREFRGMKRVSTRLGIGETWSHGDQRRTSHDDRVMALAIAAFLAFALRRGAPFLRPANQRAA